MDTNLRIIYLYRTVNKQQLLFYTVQIKTKEEES